VKVKLYTLSYRLIDCGVNGLFEQQCCTHNYSQFSNSNRRAVFACLRLQFKKKTEVQRSWDSYVYRSYPTFDNGGLCYDSFIGFCSYKRVYYSCSVGGNLNCSDYSCNPRFNCPLVWYLVGSFMAFSQGLPRMLQQEKIYAKSSGSLGCFVNLWYNPLLTIYRIRFKGLKLDYLWCYVFSGDFQ